MKMENQMFNHKVSQIIVTFAFFYSAIICHFKAIETFQDGKIILSYFLWFCALTSFLGGLRFQIAKLVKKIKEINKSE
tara:strand:+ start:1461 stop:1694 length:234 start_codon:yes stop_codon:yes gene_type:complete